MASDAGTPQRYKLERVFVSEIAAWCDPERLAANRAGHLTSGQRGLLLEKRWDAGPIFLATLGLVTVGLALLNAGMAALAAYMRLAWPFSAGWTWRPIVGAIGLALLALSAWLWPRAIRRRRRFRTLVQDRRVELAPGRIQWGGKQHEYVARLDDGQVLERIYLTRLPPPGRFLLAYVPGTGLLLSAEPVLDPASEEEGHRLLQDALDAALHATPGERRRNSEGAIPAGQTPHHLEENKPVSARALVVTTLVSEALAVSFVPLALVARFLVGAILPVLILVLNAGLLFWIEGRRSALDVGRAVSVEGIAHREMVALANTANYYYWVGDQRFGVGVRAYGALIDGLRYRAHYLGGSHRILSMEAQEAPW